MHVHVLKEQPRQPQTKQTIPIHNSSYVVVNDIMVHMLSSMTVSGWYLNTFLTKII